MDTAAQPIAPDAFDAHLAALGAHPAALPAARARALDEVGYAVVEGALGGAELAALRARFDELVAGEGAAAGSEHVPEPGTDRLCDLANKGAVFDRVWCDPLALAAVRRVIGRPFRLSSLNGRDVLPGHGLQALHADWWRPRDAGVRHVANAIWVLDDFTADNGATRVVPGSHRSTARPPEVLADPLAPHPDEVLVRCPAGSVIIIDGHLWHGGTRNASGARRRVFHAYYCAREHEPQLDQRRYARAETRARLPLAARVLLGIA